MAAVKFRHFIHPEILMSIAPERLLSLLLPYHEYLTKRGLVFPDIPKVSINCTQLSVILADLDEQVPSQMVDALYFISETANIGVVDELIADARAAHPEMEFDMDASNTDIIVQIWLENPDLVTTKQAESMINKPKSFEYFRGREPRPMMLSIPEQATIEEMEIAMNYWFGKNRRGRNCRIITADHGDKISFLIRHGMPMQRRTSIKNDKSETLCYRPEVFDVVFYDRAQNELGVRAMGTKGEKNLYRQNFGYYLFNSYNYFHKRQKYTLAPLALDGTKALVCSDIDGLEQVTLTAIRNSLNEGYNGHNIYSADDVFLSMIAQEKTMPPASNLTRAVFSMKLTGVKNQRSLTIEPPNRAMYHRDGESVVIDQFLSKRGFIYTPGR